MSGSSVFLFVGSTTLVAAAVTLLAYQMTAARFERRANRRSRTLEGPVPGRRSLSTIGLNTESARSTPRTPRSQNRQPANFARPAIDAMPELELMAMPLPLTPYLDDDTKLNSLQTIRARSASLNTDAQPDQSAGPRPLTPDDASSAQRLPKRPLSDAEQEQGPATSRARTRKEKTEGDDRGAQSFAPTPPRAESPTALKTPTSRRAKRANAQAERTEMPRRRSDQASTDAPADPSSLDILATLQPGDIGGSLSRDSSLPDMFAGLNEADTGIPGLADDLSDIDGGGLPTPPPKTPQKSKR